MTALKDVQRQSAGPTEPRLEHLGRADSAFAGHAKLPSDCHHFPQLQGQLVDKSILRDRQSPSVVIERSPHLQRH
ncbi:MAG: hypothetical protein NVSMB52_14980 [Chloroflexota bacterium]